MEPTVASRPSYDETIPGPNNSLSIAEIRTAFARLEAEPSRRSIPGALRILYEQVKARETYVSVGAMTVTSWVMCSGAIAAYVFSPPLLKQRVAPWAIVMGLLSVVGILFSFRYRHSIARSKSETALIRSMAVDVLARLATVEEAKTARLDKDQVAELKALLKATKRDAPELTGLLMPTE